MRFQFILLLAFLLFFFVGVVGAEETVARHDLENRIEALFKEAQGLESRANSLRVVGRALTPEEHVEIERSLRRVGILHKLIDVLKKELRRAGDRDKVTLSEKGMGAVRKLREAYEKAGRERTGPDFLRRDQPRKEGAPRSVERKERRGPDLPRTPEMELMRMRHELLHMESQRLQLEAKRLKLESERHLVESKARQLEASHLEIEMQAMEIDRRIGGLRKRLERAEARSKQNSDPKKAGKKRRKPQKGAPRKEKKENQSQESKRSA